MKRLSFENGEVVIRDLDGKLVWSSHILDIEDFPSAGYKEILIEGELVEKNLFTKTEKKIKL